MTKEEKYEAALEQARKELKTCGDLDCDAARLIFRLFPQLRESEDERIRKNCIHFLEYQKSHHADTREIEECIAWLEKQKEQKPNIEICPHSIKSKSYKENGYPIAQKPAEWSEEDEKTRRNLMSLLVNMRGDRIKEETYQKYYPWLKSLPERFNLQPKQEWSEVELEFRGEKVKVKRPFFRDDKGRGYSTTEQDEDVAWNALRAWCEKKGVSLYDLYPREKWDEVDETKLRDVIRIVEDSGYIKSIQEHYKEFLSSLPERFNLRPVKQEWSEDEQTVIDCVVDVLEKDGLSSLAASVRHLRPQPKQEWSDEDDEIFNNIIEKAKGGHWIEVNEITWLINRFKSLRPRPHKEVYQAAKHDLAIKFMNYLDENRPEGKMCLSNVECEDIDKAFKENDWVKIMRYVEKYHPHWKPSEEQMEALFTAASEAPIIKENGNYLYDLYNDLKKLM